MEEQISLMKLTSLCRFCFYEEHGQCINYHSEYFEKEIPFSPCTYYDGTDLGEEHGRSKEN